MAACLGGACLGASAAWAQAPETARPSFLLITLDTTRADRLQAWGGRGRITPSVDRLAREGVRFMSAVAAAPSTGPSHASMLTGLDPAQHRLQTNAAGLPDSIESVAQTLKRAGYRTAAFLSVRFLLDRNDLGRGFETAECEEGRRVARATTQPAMAWLNGVSGGDAPFFAWIHYYDAHSPYPLTPWTAERLRDYTGEIRGIFSVADFGLGRWILDPEDVRAVTTRYDGLVRQTDKNVGVLLRWARAKGLLENTVVILAADHGQALGEHRLPGHGGLWESILHVPLVIWDGRSPAPRTVRERVGLVDIAPTLLELAGLQVPATQQGRSLAPALRGEPLADRPYFSQRWKPPAPDRTPMESQIAKTARQHLDPTDYDTVVYEGALKMLSGKTGTVLFDVAADPDEARPLQARDRPDAWNRMLELIDERRAVSPKAPETDDLRDDLREQLRALGYLE